MTGKIILKNGLYPLVFACWAAFLFYLLLDNQYTAFLRPEFGLLLIIAHFIAMGFMLATLSHEHITQEKSLFTVTRVLVLLVPILFFLTMPNNMLGTQAFKKRFTGTDTGSIAGRSPSSLSNQGAESDHTPLSEEEKSAMRDNTDEELTILEILINPPAYDGKKVILKGMFLHDEELKQYLGGRDTALYRFLINCCAADALPLAIALEPESIQDIGKDQWVQVTGVIAIKEINGNQVPVLQLPEIKKTTPPAIPFLF